MNYSRQREMILEVVAQTHEHPTAETVYQSLKAQHPRLSLATVYRNLNQLCDAGTLKRLRLTDSPDRFDYNTDPHCHFCCGGCGRVIDLDVASVDWAALLAQPGDHRIDCCEINFYGLCDHCAKTSYTNPQ